MGVEAISVRHAEIAPSARSLESSEQSLITTHAPAFVRATQYTYHDDPPNRLAWQPGVREWLVMTCISILVTMDAFNTTVVIPLMPGLADIFQQDLENALWISTSYLIGNASGQALFAMFAEILGAGPILLCSAVLATTGTGVCGGSLSLPVLVAGRFIQGMGGGGVLGISHLIVLDLIPPTHQVRFFSYVFRAQVVGIILGLVGGGVFDDYAAWIWAFYSSFVFCAMGMLVIPFALDLRGQGDGPKGTPTSRFRGMDWIGATLILPGLGCVMVGIGWGGTQFAWDSWQTLVPVCVGTSLLGLLVVYEAKWAAQPMFGARVFRDVSSSMLQMGGFLHGFIFSSQIHFVPVYLVLIQGLRATVTGVSLVTLTGLTLPTIVIAGALQHSGPVDLATWTIRIGWLISAAASGCFLLFDTTTPPPAWVFILLAAGLGHSLLTPGYYVSIQVHAPRDRARLSTSPILVHSILRTWGMCLAVPLSATVVTNSLSRTSIPYATHLASYLPEESKDAHTHALQVLWILMTVAVGLGGLSSLGIRRA